MDKDKLAQNAYTYQQQSREHARNFQPMQRSHKSPHSQNLLQRYWVSLTISLAAIGLTAGFVYLITTQVKFETQPSPSSVPVVAKKPQPVKFYSTLSHLEVPDEAATTKPVTAIMIENSPDARPQSGLKDAELVFEAIAEGGITRFLCLYQINKPQLIGPVRSLREYYVDWLTPYQPSVAHVGGSAAALKMIRNGRYRDIDQFFNGQFYWRSRDRYAPHNVYTSFEKLDTLNQQRNYLKSEPQTFARQAFQPPKDTNFLATKINFRISSLLYNVDYVYNIKTNQYQRHVGGKPHLDREKGQITANAVIAIQTDMQRILQDGYREQITTIGQGQAYVFQNGQVVEVTWKKPAQNQALRFYRADGQELAINAGPVWISAIPNSSGKVSWQ